LIHKTDGFAEIIFEKILQILFPCKTQPMLVIVVVVVGLGTCLNLLLKEEGVGQHFQFTNTANGIDFERPFV
jgi:hypothetical protein